MTEVTARCAICKKLYPESQLGFAGYTGEGSYPIRLLVCKTCSKAPKPQKGLT